MHLYFHALLRKVLQSIIIIDELEDDEVFGTENETYDSDPERDQVNVTVTQFEKSLTKNDQKADSSYGLPSSNPMDPNNSHSKSQLKNKKSSSNFLIPFL